MEFFLGVLVTVLAFAAMPPTWTSTLSWRVRDGLYELRAWWKAAKRRGGE